MLRAITILFLLNSLFLNAQKKEESEIKIRIACGFAGITSPEVSYIQNLIKTNKPLLIKQLLSSENKISNILSVIALQELRDIKETQLTDEELEKINLISKWSYNFSICNTCTNHFIGQVYEILNKKNIFVYELLKRELFKYR